MALVRWRRDLCAMPVGLASTAAPGEEGGFQAMPGGLTPQGAIKGERARQDVIGPPGYASEP